MSNGPERRQAKRVSIRLPVVIRGGDGTPLHGTTENVSRRGMLVVAQRAPNGTRLRIAVTGSDGREREVSGDVVRTTDDGKVAISLTDELDTGIVDST